MWKKFLAAALMLGLVAGLVTACGKKEEPKEELVIEKEEPKEEIPENQNLLTGLATLSEGAIGKRPVAVMVNNVPKAMPQYGIDQADVIFEIPVEGDATRLMALYGDYTQVPQICSVRSCRYYFPAFARGFDAFYIHWGADDLEWFIDDIGVEHYDGMHNPGGLFGRDQERLNGGYALEHTSFFDGTRLPAVLESEGRSMDLAEDR